ncbi:MAG: arsenate reductase ArsC [Candidatus Eremiobacteraeota bacterium]|nr:arsenate reductase ArsC [Candidatus Eremiobacteraeota bacterium]
MKILYLCTGNSARSQMAEAWTRHLKGGILEPYSAGIEAHGINPLTVEVMKEAGIDISGQRSKTSLELLKEGVKVDYVVTLCDDARASCPFFPAQVKVLHHGFRDPAKAEGSHEDRLKVFREVRDEIRAYVESLPESLPG